MLPLTVGKSFYPGARIALESRYDDNFSVFQESGDYLGIVLTTEGSGILTAGKAKRPFATPELFCIPANQSIRLEHKVNLKDYTLFFHPSVVNDSLGIPDIQNMDFKPSGTLRHDIWLLRRLFAGKENGPFQIHVGPLTVARMVMLFDQVHEQFVKQPDALWPCRGRSYFLELLMLTERISGECDSFVDDFPDGQDIEELHPVLLYLNSSYREKISISDLAKKFNTNRTTLGERFVRATGMSPINYLIKLRIRTASVLLQDTSVPVTEIIERTGFDDANHFGKMFKKYTGVAPSEYRKLFKIPSYIRA